MLVKAWKGDEKWTFVIIYIYVSLVFYLSFNKRLKIELIGKNNFKILENHVLIKTLFTEWNPYSSMTRWLKFIHHWTDKKISRLIGLKGKIMGLIYRWRAPRACYMLFFIFYLLGTMINTSRLENNFFLFLNFLASDIWHYFTLGVLIGAIHRLRVLSVGEVYDFLYRFKFETVM